MVITVDTNPANKVVEELNSKTKNNILLVGKSGYGKTKVLEKYQNSNTTDKVILDGTISSLNYSCIYDNDINNLYIICITIKQILEYIKINYQDKYNNNFKLISKTVESIIAQIKDMKIVQSYSKIDINPEHLVNSLVSNIKDSFNSEDITLVIDDFDKVNYSSIRYQKLIYSTLQKYLKLVLTVSDTSVYESDDRLKELSYNNDIVVMDYSLNPEDVYNIILNYFNIYELISYETIEKIIEITNGNLNIILKSINYLKQNMARVTDNDYDKFLLQYLKEYNNIINKEFHGSVRKLHI